MRKIDDLLLTEKVFKIHIYHVQSKAGPSQFYQRTPCPYGACLRMSAFCNDVGNRISAPGVDSSSVFLSSFSLPESIYTQIVTSVRFMVLQHFQCPE